MLVCLSNNVDTVINIKQLISTRDSKLIQALSFYAAGTLLSWHPVINDSGNPLIRANNLGFC